MADFFIPDWGVSLKSLYDAFAERDEWKEHEKKPHHHENTRKLEKLGSLVPYVRRESVCIAGFHRESVQDVKKKIYALLDNIIPLESFHVKQASDVYDGAFLSPKIVLVGIHSPGRKILDEEDDEGQLDHLYDEACRLGADVFVVYAGLPKHIYPPVRSIYHPRLADNIFPQQPLIKMLASENHFLTISDNSDLNNIQKNLLREWLGMPSHMEAYLTSAGEEESVLFDITSEIPGPVQKRFKQAESDQKEERKKHYTKSEKKKKHRRRKKYTFEKDGDDNVELLNEHTRQRPAVELDLYRSFEMPPDSPGAMMYESL